MTTWPTQADSTLDSVYAMQAGLTVRLIMTPRKQLMTCRAEDSVDSIVEKDVDRFSFLPVVQGPDIIGLYNAEQWFDKSPPPGRLIGEDFEPLKEQQLIGCNASILDFVKAGVDRPTRLVVSGGEIEGLVCMADLHKLPVRAALFSVVTALEMAMAERIEGKWPDGGWLNLLSSGRRGKVEARIAEAKSDDVYVSDIESTEFIDKTTIIRKQRLVSGSNTKLRSEFKAIENLRNSLAHAKDFAATPSDAIDVSKTVSKILDFASQLRRSAVASAC